MSEKPPLLGEDLGDRLLECQRYSGIRPTALAKLIGVEYTTWRTWVRPDKEKRKRPGLDNIKAVARRTGFPLLEIIGDEEVDGWVPEQDAYVDLDVHPALNELREKVDMTDEEFRRLAQLNMRGLSPTQQNYLWFLQGFRDTAGKNDVTTEAAEAAEARGGRKLR